MRDDGITKERPFDTVEEMDEALISNWNSVVGVKDMVYVLGDAVINRSALPLLGRLKGRKQLVLGNHDLFRTAEYLQYFENVRGSFPLDGFILTHIPIHEAELGRWKGNTHGHLHSKNVMGKRWYMDEEGEWNYATDVVDTRYLCVSVEYTEYKPISLDDVNKRFSAQQTECT